ncbi:MAG: foldase protein PrsA, partial [Terriglobales bacterium]
IQNYYQNNKAAYQEATLDRLYVPRTQQQEPSKDSSKESEADAKKRQADSEAAMKKEADDLRARAAAGEDFSKLEAEAYKTANIKAAPPAVKMEKARLTTLPPSQASVFDMKNGDVSPVLTDTAGYFVYKLEAKDAIPLERVRDEIRSTLQKQKMQDAMQTMQQSATPSFDEAYFASVTPAPPSRAPGAMPGVHPPAPEPSTGPK